jgi:hypothetical protein
MTWRSEERRASERRFASVTVLGQVAMRPKVTFDNRHIRRRLEACRMVARAYGWHPNHIASFSAEVEAAFSYEDAMAVIEREFDTTAER